MINVSAKRLAFLTGYLWLAGITIAISGLSGCATSVPTGSTVANNKMDVVTDSDEPETRKRARLHLDLAVAYFNDGKTTIALDAIKQSINADATLFEAYNLRGLIYMRLENNPLAEDSFRKALALNPKAASVQHNYGWMLCQQSRYSESAQLFAAALTNSTYDERAKTWMARGLCELKAGQPAQAEASLIRSYELDASNPVTAYNLALMLYERKEFARAQFYVRRINNSEQANSETLWLGIKVERQLGNPDATGQLGAQLKKRFSQSKETASFERGAFDE